MYLRHELKARCNKEHKEFQVAAEWMRPYRHNANIIPHSGKFPNENINFTLGCRADPETHLAVS